MDESVKVLSTYPFVLPNGNEVHCSIGHAHSTSNSEDDVHGLMKEADEALYAAKGSDKNQAVAAK